MNNASVVRNFTVTFDVATNRFAIIGDGAWTFYGNYNRIGTRFAVQFGLPIVTSAYNSNPYTLTFVDIPYPDWYSSDSVSNFY